MFDKNVVADREEAYILGLLYADGFVTNRYRDKYYSVGITLKRSDASLLKDLQSVLRAEYNPILKDKTVYIKTREKEYFTTALHVFNVELVQNLIQLGIIPNKTYDTSAFVFENVPEEFKWDFLRGFIDGDGSITKQQGNRVRFSLVSKNKALLASILLYLHEHGLSSCRLSTDSGVWRIKSSNRKDLIALRSYLYSSGGISLDRKKKVFMDIALLKRKYPKYIVFNKKNKTYMVCIYDREASSGRRYLGSYKTIEEACIVRDQYLENKR